MKLIRFAMILMLCILLGAISVTGFTTSNLGDVVVHGNLSVNGTTTFQGNFDLGGGNLTSVNRVIGNSDNVGIGDAGDDSHSLTTDDDLFVSGKLEVDGASYFDADVLFADGVYVSFGNGVDSSMYWNTSDLIWNQTSGELNILTPMLKIWDDAQGADDYFKVWHDSASGFVDIGSGDFSIRLGGLTKWTYGTTYFRPNTGNTHDLGGAANEMRSVYLGEDTGSGSIFGLDQDCRIYYNETDADALQVRCGDPLNSQWSGINYASEGNITADNVFVKTYAFAHDHLNITNPGANLWTNATFASEAMSGEGISHDYTNPNNAAFTIDSDGVYRIHFSVSYVDSNANPTGIVAMRLANNDVEIPGSLMQKDTTMQNKIGTMHHTFEGELNSTQNVTLQWATDATTISLQSWTDLGTHSDTNTISISRTH